MLAQYVNHRLHEIVRQQQAATEELHRHQSNPPDTDGQAPELLDRIGPVSRTRLDAAAEPVLRTLFDAIGLTVTYDPAERQATVEVTVDDGTLAALETQLSPELGIFGARSAGRSVDPQLIVRGQRRSLRVTGTFAVR